LDNNICFAALQRNMFCKGMYCAQGKEVKFCTLFEQAQILKMVARCHVHKLWKPLQ